jgi:competence protein ComEC
VQAARSFWSVALIRFLCVAAGATAGFLYAASAAERRLADELPARWEGHDLRIAGIVSGLPAVNQSDRSVRFAFDVERVDTLAAIVPSRLAGLVHDVAARHRWRTASRCRKLTRRRTLGVTVRCAARTATPIRTASTSRRGCWRTACATGYVRRDEGNRRLAGIPAASSTRRAMRAKRSAGESCARSMAGPTPGAGGAAVGDQRSVPQDQWLLYNRTG